MAAQIPASEYQVLIDFYNSTNGPHWFNNTGWLNPNAQTWYGITVAGAQYDSQGNVSAPGHVDGIIFVEGGYHFLGNGLGGQISSSLMQLTQLHTLDLGNNPQAFAGSIPPWFANLTSLIYLGLSGEEFRGTIPTWLVNLSNLQILMLGNNFFSGQIPPELGNFQALERLDLFNNLLRGAIPTSLANLTNLIELDLSQNSIDGQIPAFIGSLTKLQILNLRFTHLSGSVPSFLTNLTNLLELWLSDDRLDIESAESRQTINQLASRNISLQYDAQTNFAPIPQAHLANISTRAQVGGGEQALIAGFILDGTDETGKNIVVRALGPSLPIPGALADPYLELHLNFPSSIGDVTVATNDNWKQDDASGASQRTEIETAGFAPSNDLDSALISALPINDVFEGVAVYTSTAIVRGHAAASGTALVEVYDLDDTGLPSIINFSTRGFVGANDNVMIAGFIIKSASGEPLNVLLRAIGPSLASAGVAEPIQDTTLELRDHNGSLLKANDDWKDSQEAEINDTGAPPSDARESAIVAALTAGNYTAIVRGKNGTTGLGLVEIYTLP